MHSPPERSECVVKTLSKLCVCAEVGGELTIRKHSVVVGHYFNNTPVVPYVLFVDTEDVARDALREAII